MSYTDDAERWTEAEWSVNNGIAKIFTVDRNGLDEDSEEADAWELIWIDSGGVRRHEKLIDIVADRFDGMTEEDLGLLATCPDKVAIANLKYYCGRYWQPLHIR